MSRHAVELTLGAEDHLERPSGWRRFAANAVILALLLAQFAIPLSYYLRDEPTAERFCWRMFSSVDLSTWNSQLIAIVDQNGSLVPQEFPLATTLQESHVVTVRKAQRDVVEPLMRYWLAEPGVREVQYVAHGTYPSGKPMRPIRWVLRPGEPLTLTSHASE